MYIGLERHIIKKNTHVQNIAKGRKGMCTQYKLYKLDEDMACSTMQKLKQNPKITFQKVNDHVIAIYYDYMEIVYKEILEIMSAYDASQYILTTSIFYKMLKNFFNKKIKLKEIMLSPIFREENELLDKYVKEVYIRNQNAQSIDCLLNELQWYNYDEGIDINNITFQVMKEKRMVSFSIYNNGILTIDSSTIQEKIFELLGEIL